MPSKKKSVKTAAKPSVKSAPSLAATERQVAILERRDLIARRKKVMSDFGKEIRTTDREIARLRKHADKLRRKQPLELERINRALSIVQARLGK